MRTLLMLPLLLLPFTAQAASLLPGGDYPAPDCRSPLRPLPGTIPPHAHLTYGGPLRRGAINAERRSSFSEAPRI